MELQTQLDDKHVTLDISDAAREWLAIHGYDVKMGARPMARLIQDKLKKPMAEEILFGSLSHGGGTVTVDVDAVEDKLTIEVNAKHAQPAWSALIRKREKTKKPLIAAFLLLTRGIFLSVLPFQQGLGD